MIIPTPQLLAYYHTRDDDNDEHITCTHAALCGRRLSQSLAYESVEPDTNNDELLGDGRTDITSPV